MNEDKVRASKLSISLNRDEIDKIDEWRFEHRLPSRAAAIRELIGRGMGGPPPETAEAPLVSRDVGVLASTITRALNECFVISSPHMRDTPIVYASPAFYETTGYAPHEVIGKNCRFLQGAETKKSTIKKIREALADEQVIDTEILNYRKDGTPILFQLYIEPVPDPQTGALLFFIGRQYKIE
ncbi:MAG: PAS domain-containing protein [Pseudomonadota bacterium]